jgi:hypothetical protein
MESEVKKAQKEIDENIQRFDKAMDMLKEDVAEAKNRTINYINNIYSELKNTSNELFTLFEKRPAALWFGVFAVGVAFGSAMRRKRILHKIELLKRA